VWNSTTWIGRGRTALCLPNSMGMTDVVMSAAGRQARPASPPDTTQLLPASPASCRRLNLFEGRVPCLYDPALRSIEHDLVPSPKLLGIRHARRSDHPWQISAIVRSLSMAAAESLALVFYPPPYRYVWRATDHKAWLSHRIVTGSDRVLHPPKRDRLVSPVCPDHHLDKLRKRASPHLLHDTRAVVFRGSNAHIKFRRNHLVRMPFNQ